MFNDTKTLIVVYKDEMLLNQLRKLVESNDDLEDGRIIVGTRDDSINIISWDEKTWLAQKKAGNITNKVLFLGNIKGTDMLIPVVEEQFCQYGVHYGWAGNQAIVYADMKALKMSEYQGFLAQLDELPVPETIKKANRIELHRLNTQNFRERPTVEDKIEETSVMTDGNNIRKNPLKSLKNIGDSISEAVEKAGTDVAVYTQDLFKNKKMMERQMLFYGVINLYNNGLETFMLN